ncbi:LutC/YkgG family protein [Saccharothrix syringae]|uniref:Lactate utilization protein C n=1 Tax=Saccharothrix syringae TaxID=103733 RepID=A0A5Q0GW77_SACSY|nr:LUD domain-containing protein [Saccharothrix syringae]QFZ18191.1 lactate utilization protein C [Saccharothrix syringae]
MSARDEVLARVRRAKGSAAAPVPRDYRAAGSRGPGDPVLFAERLRDYRARVRVVPADDLVAAVAAALRERGARLVVAAPGTPPEWAPDATRTPVDVATLERADAVLTACHVAIAETGTIVLDHDAADQGPRALTLVPDYHLVVVRASQVVAGVPDAVAALADVRTQTWISGPSATSDIELERVEGVHGPRTLEVILTT